VNRENFDKGVGFGSKVSVFNALMGAFLMFNLVIRFCTIFYYPPYHAHIAGFFVVVVSCCVFVILFPKYLQAFLFLFGFSFFLFGFGSIDIQSRVFELIVACVATTLFVINWRAKETHPVNRRLVVLILCYVGLSLFSLLLLPVRQIVKDLWFFGFPDSIYYLFIGPPYGFYYPEAAVIQLALFVILAVQLSSSSFRDVSYKSLFTGMFSGAVFCAFIGLLDFYGIISLAWYRFGETVTPGVLHSTFQNRNCFGEFVLTVIPFVMVGFLSKIKGIWWKVFLFGCLVICEIALILAGGRAGWVTYPLILFICWLFSYFSKEGRLESFRFKWRDLVKVAISVPITIVISLLLIFYVLMPLADHLKNKSGMTGISKDSESTTSYLKGRMKTIGELDPAGRDVTWGQGFYVGKEGFVYGMGYESFLWHANILSRVSASYFNKFCDGRKKIHDSPHNVLFSIFVSGGIVGVCLWLLIVGYAVILLTVDLIKNKRLLNIPVVISIISFHIYGMVQSMQHIPMVWLLIFLCLGYAMTMDEGVLPVRVRRTLGILTKISVVMVVIGFFVYLSNFESKSLADKYGLKIYAMDQERDRFAGFFQHSKRWKYGDYRWSGKKGAIYVPGGGIIELDFRCETPDAEKEPVVLTVSNDGRVLDKISFSKKDTVRRKYELPVTSGNEKGQRSEVRGQRSEVRGQRSEVRGQRSEVRGQRSEVRGQRSEVRGQRSEDRGRGSEGGKEQKLLLEVSRTWNPHKYLGNFDRRDLGVGVIIFK
jgi:O-antigen ligase